MKTIATHSGVFHADDVFAIAGRKLVCPDAKIIRTRDPDMIEEAHETFDVGGEWWIYIRVAATLVMLSVGGSVGSVFGQFAGGIVGAYLGSKQ